MRQRVFLLAAGLSLSSLALYAAPPPREALVFVDDRGIAVSTPVVARLVVPLDGVPASVELRATLELPKAWTGLVEIDGEGHGPVRKSVSELRSESGPLVLPRKANLRLENSGVGGLSLSYYSVVDGTLIRVRHEDVVEGAELRVPSGSGLLVARQREKGRDIRLLSLRPGSTTRIEPRYAQNQVALLRVLRLADGSPVVRAVVEAAEDRASERSARASRRLCQTDEFGLCLILATEPHLSAVIAADGLVAIRSQFALEADDPRLIETVRMSLGARPTFQVLLDGEPGAAFPVQLRLTGAAAAGSPVSEVKTFSGSSDDRGRWRPCVVPPGTWVVRIHPESGHPAFEKRVELVSGSEDLIDVRLSRIRITGALTRGAKGVAGAAIIVAPRDTGEKHYSTDVDAKEQEVLTDSEGEFEAYVWREGVYDIFAGGLARKTVSVPIVGTRVLLRIAESDIPVVVVGPDGSPIEGASVTYTEAGQNQSWTRMVKTDSEGKVKFMAQGGSAVSISAAAIGFKRSEKTKLVVPAEGAIQPVRVQLERDQTLPGRFVGQMGSPVPRADIWATSATGEVVSSSPTTDSSGRFEVSRGKGREFRLILVSPDAPLTVHRVYDVGQNEEMVFASAERGLLEVQFSDSKGAPIVSKSAVLQYSDIVIQPALLARHLSLRGLPPYSDVRGNLLIPDLSPGEYVVIVPDVPSPSGMGPLRVGVYVAPGRNSVRLTLQEATPQ